MVSDLSKRVVRATRNAIDEHHRAHLGEAEAAATAALRVLANSQGAGAMWTWIHSIADEIERDE